MTLPATPRLSVFPDGVTAGPEPGLAHVCWQLTNLTQEPVELLECWLPHGRFRGERQAFEPVRVLAAGASTRISRDVQYDAASGETFENAFLILRLRFGSRPWRVLTRMTVSCTQPNDLNLVVEAVTAHPVGFTGAGREECDAIER